MLSDPKEDKKGLTLDRIAFIGRTFDVYAKMFDLDEHVLRRGPILDCPAGASSFTSEALKNGYDATACDILYNLTLDEMREKAEKDIRYIYEKLDEVLHLYTWKYYKNKDGLVKNRETALRSFLQDFEKGFRKGRYIQGELPDLPFSDKSFSLVLSSHFLFLYGDMLSLEFHKASLRELVRVCSGEIRIYPLLGLDAKPFPYLDEAVVSLQSEGVKVAFAEVPFEFQIGADKMMKIVCG